MSTSTATLPSYINDDVDFRTWAQGIHNLLIAAGLTQTADTGQINLTTAARPGTNAYAGYEVFRFSDALQATAPIFIKVAYGIASFADRPAIRVSVGTATNGGGGLLGQLSSVTDCISAGGDAPGATRLSGASGDGSQIHLFCNEHSSSNSPNFGFCVERTRDETGAQTAAGVQVVWITTGSPSFQTIPATGTVPNTNGSAYLAPGIGRPTYGNDVVMSPLLVLLGRVYYTFMAFMASSTISGATVFTADSLGATHTFRTVLGTNDTFAFLWE